MARRDLAQRVVGPAAHGDGVLDVHQAGRKRLGEHPGDEQRGIPQSPQRAGAGGALLLQRFLEEQRERTALQRAVFLADQQRLGLQEAGQEVREVQLGRLVHPRPLVLDGQGEELAEEVCHFADDLDEYGHDL